MDLVLWRHADAEVGTPDLGRALTHKGHKQARRVAAWLHRHLPDSARVLVSPARRARETAQALAELSGHPLHELNAIAPGASVADLLAAVGWPGDDSTVVVVGHQPTLGEVAGHLLTGRASEFSIKKGAVWWLAGRRHQDAASEVVLRAVISPDLM